MGKTLPKSDIPRVSCQKDGDAQRQQNKLYLDEESRKLELY